VCGGECVCGVSVCVCVNENVCVRVCVWCVWCVCVVCVCVYGCVSVCVSVYGVCECVWVVCVCVSLFLLQLTACKSHLFTAALFYHL